jgi:hypothetical protein
VTRSADSPARARKQSKVAYKTLKEMLHRRVFPNRNRSGNSNFNGYCTIGTWPESVDNTNRTRNSDKQQETTAVKDLFPLLMSLVRCCSVEFPPGSPTIRPVGKISGKVERRRESLAVQAMHVDAWQSLAIQKTDVLLSS